MKERIAEVRKKLGLSQNEMADRLGLSRNFISLMENGNRIPSDRTIADICREFNVNRVWLETGVGEPFDPVSREDRIADILSQAIAGTSTARDRLIRALCRLPDDAFPIIEKYILEAAESLQDEKSE
jgi:transcriptional regulator with XRE-family HTH domain